MPDREIFIDPAFEGPPASAHGGYTCGVLATYLPSDAEITLRKPVPLGTGLRLAQDDGRLALYDEDNLVAEGATTQLEDRTPAPPTFAEALEASAAFPGLDAHPFPSCLGCGTGRTDAVALRIFPGPVPGRELVAAVWYPGRDATADGRLKPEYAWAALDCPGGWAGIGKVDQPAVLGRMAARLEPSAPAQSAYIVVGWLDSVSGRKLATGSALYTRDGAVQGFSRQTWITVGEAR
jgi:hypothetical protein